MKGTPKSIEDAIRNAIEEITQKKNFNQTDEIRIIKRHVKDFMAQKFQVIETDQMLSLWQTIFPPGEKE